MLKIKKVSQEKINPLDVLKERRSLLDDITEELESKGVEFFRPIEMEGSLNIEHKYLSLPKDITNVSSRQLGQYLNAYTQQRMYLRTLMSWQEISLEEAKRKYYDKSDTHYQQVTSENRKMSETAKERFVNNLPQVKPAFLEFKDEKRKLDVLNYNLASIEDAIFLISREVSRRESDWSTENRNESVQRR